MQTSALDGLSVCVSAHARHAHTYVNVLVLKKQKPNAVVLSPALQTTGISVGSVIAAAAAAFCSF